MPDRGENQLKEKKENNGGTILTMQKMGSRGGKVLFNEVAKGRNKWGKDTQ